MKAGPYGLISIDDGISLPVRCIHAARRLLHLAAHRQRSMPAHAESAGHVERIGRVEGADAQLAQDVGFVAGQDDAETGPLAPSVTESSSVAVMVVPVNATCDLLSGLPPERRRRLPARLHYERSPPLPDICRSRRSRRSCCSLIASISNETTDP